MIEFVYKKLLSISFIFKIFKEN